jgi:hypothetical protein
MMKKQLTVNGCCDTVNITKGQTTVTFENHQFTVTVFFCSNCGNKKATSNIREGKYEN